MNRENFPDRWHFGRRLLIIGAVTALALFGLMSLLPPRDRGGFEAAYAGRYALLLVFVVFSLAAARKRLALIAAELLTWAAVMLVLIAGYSYRFELQDLAHRVTAELVPTQGRETAPGVVSFPRALDGQFWIDAQVDGRPVRFLLDTGASGVVLSPADAARLGFTPDRLSFSQSADTANGRIREAPVVLGEIRIGSIRFDRVPASVSAGGLRDSLLGMHLLERLSSIEIRKDMLTIRE
jgi:aspartyl protease family protein